MLRRWPAARSASLPTALTALLVIYACGSPVESPSMPGSPPSNAPSVVTPSPTTSGEARSPEATRTTNPSPAPASTTTAPTPTPTPTPTGMPPYSVLLRMSFADGSPAWQAVAYADSLDRQEDYVGSKEGPGVRLLNFRMPGSYCIWVSPSGDYIGYPVYTLSASGTLIANSDHRSPDCNLSVPFDGLVIDVSYPVFTLVTGVVLGRAGTACDASVLATTSQKTFSASAVTRSNGHFTMYLVPGKWTFSAVGNEYRRNEFGPDVRSTLVDIGEDGAKGIQVLCGTPPVAVSGGVIA